MLNLTVNFPPKKLNQITIKKLDDFPVILELTEHTV